MPEPITDAAVDIIADLLEMVHSKDQDRMVAAGQQLATLSRGQLTMLVLTAATILEEEVQHSADQAGLTFEAYIAERAGG